MGLDEQFASWKRQRGKITTPSDFADRVMLSVYHDRRHAWRLVLLRIATAAWRSTLVRVGVCLLVVAAWVIRVGSLATILIPLTVGH